MTAEIKSAYLAPEGFSKPLLKEVDGVIVVHNQLILSSQPFINAHWAQNIWKNPSNPAKWGLKWPKNNKKFSWSNI